MSPLEGTVSDLLMVELRLCKAVLSPVPEDLHQLVQMYLNMVGAQSRSSGAGHHLIIQSSCYLQLPACSSGKILHSWKRTACWDPNMSLCNYSILWKTVDYDNAMHST